MTPQELADSMAPQVREAAERSKADILAGLLPMKRILVKGVWGMGMRDGVPAANRIIIEFLIAKYRAELEPILGEMVDVLIRSISEEGTSDPRLKLLQDIMTVLRTPTSRFHPAVLAALDPSLPRIVVDYGEATN